MTEPVILVDGLRELNHQFSRAGAAYPKELKEIHRRVAEPIADEAARNTDPISGRLAGSVKARGSKRAGRVTAGARLRYAGVQNYGWPTHNIEPKLFLQRAIDSERDSVLDLYKTLTDEFLNQTWSSRI